MQSIYEIAQKYHSKGWVVVPVKPGTKRPALTSWTEFEKRRPTENELKSWFENNNVGIGVITGELSNLTVVDNDSHKPGAEGLNLETPLKAQSGGGGQHFFFKYNPKVTTFKNEKIKVDVRSQGGFIVLPPTIHPQTGKRYKWLTTIDDINRLPVCPDEIQNYNLTPPGKKIDIKELVGVPEGGRDDSMLRLANSLLFRRYDEAEVLATLIDVNRTYNPPLPENIVRQKLEQAIKFYNSQQSEDEDIEIPNKELSWPSQLAKQGYHGLAGEIVNIISPHSEADTTAILVNFLTAFGNIIGDKTHFKVEADRHPARLFCVLVGETSKGRKGTSWGYIRNLFKSIDEKFETRVQEGMSSGEGLIWAVRDKIIKKTPIKEKGRIVDYEDQVVDEGVEDKRLLVLETEFASTLRVLEREGNTLSAIIRRAWDSGNLQTLTKNSPAVATGAHVSIIGHITREELLRYLNDIEQANGFGNRFLWFCVKRSKMLPHGSNIDSVDFSQIIEKLKKAVNIASSVDEIKWSVEARTIWEKVYPLLSEGKPGLFGGITARAEAYVVRLSCIYALLDLSSSIKPQHIAAALAVWDYVEDSVKYIFQNRTGDSIANKILKALQDKEDKSMSRTEIRDLFGRNLKAERITAALEILETNKLVTKEEISTEGRSQEVWSLRSFIS